MLDDSTSRVEVVIFESLLNLRGSLLKLNQLLFVKGILNVNFINAYIKIIANDLMDLSMVKKKIYK